MTTRHALVRTAIGELTAVLHEAPDADGSTLTGVYFPGHWTRPDPADFGERIGEGDDPVLIALAEQLADYLAGERRDFDLPLGLRGGGHHLRVWDRLTRIPYGETVTYGELATQLGGGAQAVGRAVGANPISIIVPCHRVVGSDGSLTGYAGGLERKRALLALEEPAAVERGALF
ncbi:methylated-DNA--[protein]-cysteine S-methyltransferase [Janibacter sp. GS2]|uniref:methylated-DNA--[protein]-cysteine S-methyltransferase n=1 Tax=Janibacter sp. GS2 TaxID=3442646 RepID=UPI003EBBBF48